MHIMKKIAATTLLMSYCIFYGPLSLLLILFKDINKNLDEIILFFELVIEIPTKTLLNIATQTKK